MIKIQDHLTKYHIIQVKELGVLVKDCPPLAEDIQKVFEIYWLFEILYANKDQGQRKEWPIELSTQFNASNPIEISFIKPIMPPLLAFISVYYDFSRHHPLADFIDSFPIFNRL